jgi:hypothetical protein
MAQEDAVSAAQKELPSLGISGTVIEVAREGRKAVIVLKEGGKVSVSGLLAIKLLFMLRSSYGRWKKYRGHGSGNATNDGRR